MKKLNFLKYGFAALMMAFAMTLCYSCSSDDDEQNNNQEVNPPSNGESGTINGHAYVKLAGLKWSIENVGEEGGLWPLEVNDIYGYYYKQADVDFAAKCWGSGWTVPTKDQWEALLDECNWTWMKDYTFNGKTMNGYIVSDKKDSSTFIFLPAAGISYNGNGVYNLGDRGCYWSKDYADYLYVLSNGSRQTDRCSAQFGMSVRLVGRS